MYLVAQSHLRGGTRWSVNAIAAELSFPGISVARLVEALEAGMLLVTAEHEHLLPARDAGSIRLDEILAVARAANSVHGDNAAVAPAPVIGLCEELEGAWRAHLGSRTLEAWVNEAR